MFHFDLFYAVLHLNFTFFILRYADILAGKLQQKVSAVEKIIATRRLLKEKIEQFKQEKAIMQPLVGKLTEQTKMLQSKVSRTKFNSPKMLFKMSKTNFFFQTLPIKMKK